MRQKTHGIMFHHFHGEKKHIVSQGSISAEKFDDMLRFYEKTHTIITAEEFIQKSRKDTLSEKEVCLTFDDGLLCQFDIAYPVMKQRGLTAFWFIYSSPMDGVLEKLEIYRHFRFSKFHDIEEFYSAFFELVGKTETAAFDKLKTFRVDEYAENCPFYTPNDKRFRYLRDVVLGETKYNRIMDQMIEEYNYNIQENVDILWLNPLQIKELHNNGHAIGLHSYSHPTVMSKKSMEEQKKEYGINKEQLEAIINDKVISVSYPCNSYNTDTLTCMKELGIQIGFRANMADERLENIKLEYPREDHANIIKLMEGK